MNKAATISRTNFNYMYWSSAQQLAHHTSSGCAISRRPHGLRHHLRPDEGLAGVAARNDWDGREPITLAGESTRRSSRMAT